MRELQSRMQKMLFVRSRLTSSAIQLFTALCVVAGTWLWASDAAADLALPDCADVHTACTSCKLGKCQTPSGGPGTSYNICDPNSHKLAPPLCVPDGTCSPGNVTACRLPCNDGLHFTGHMTCSATGEWNGVCLPPPTDACGDLLDNDCDGFVDNGPNCGRNPLVIIPGVAGTRLLNDSNDEVWPGCPWTDHGDLSLAPNGTHPNIHAAGPIFFAGGDCAAGFGAQEEYEEVIDINYEHYGSDYLVDNDRRPIPGFLYPPDFGFNPGESDPARRYPVISTDNHSLYTSAGCTKDMFEGYIPPRVFTFGYDWRRDNETAALALRDFLGCVKQFWPGRQVDVVAHSMGGLVVRRYLLDFPNDHLIEHVATVDTPWLGAPKVIFAMDTGNFIEDETLVTHSEIKQMLEFFPGPQELIPPLAYFDLLEGSWICSQSKSCSPYAEQNVPGSETLGIANFTDHGIVDYLPFGVFGRQFNSSFSTNPVYQSLQFHLNPGQDDWTNDRSGVKYLHVFGIQDQAYTPLRIVRKLGAVAGPNRTLAVGIEEYREYGIGDGTVPFVSQARLGSDFGVGGLFPSSLPANVANLNAPAPPQHGAPGAALLPVYANTWNESGDGRVDNDTVEHTKITHNRFVMKSIWNFFENDDIPAWPEPLLQRTSRELKITNAASVMVQDSSGAWFDAVHPKFNVASSNVAPGVESSRSTDGLLQIVMDDRRPYVVRIVGNGQPGEIELKSGLPDRIDNLVKFQDLTIPAGIAAQFSSGTAGFSTVSLDMNGDSVFETPIAPTADLSGPQASDSDGPTVQITRDPNVDNTYTIQASDTFGVKDIFYSVDGGQTYTQVNESKVILCLSSTPSSISALADDRSGNRSAVTQIVAAAIPAAPSDQPTVLSRAGWGATASSAAGGDAANALDGNASSRWSTGADQTTGQWISIDMREPRTFSQVTIDTGSSANDFPIGYQVFASNDGYSWGAPLASGSGASGLLTVVFPAQSARFLGVVQTGSGSHWWSIAELNVYGGAAIPVTPIAPVGWVASASPSAGSDTPARAIDGSTSSRWSTGAPQTYGQYFQVDMQSARKITRITMDSGNSSNDYARGYQVFATNDPTSWGSAIASGTGGAPKIEVALSPMLARYVKVVQTGSSSNWWSLAEFTISGVGTFGPVAAPLSRISWQAAASDTCQGDVPRNALDGASSTRFSTGRSQAAGQWFQVDLGAAQAFTSISLDAGASSSDYPRGYQVLTSNDGVAWTGPVATGAGGGQVTTIAFARQTARFIKIVLTASSSNWWSIHELNVYGVPPALLVRSGWIASASNNIGMATNGIDGELSTRWTTGTVQASGQWYQVDMLVPQTVNQITLNSDGSASDYPRNYEVWTSIDGVRWGAVPVATGIGSSSMVSIALPVQVARYIRVKQTGATSNWWSISEMNVWGPSAEVCRTE